MDADAISVIDGWRDVTAHVHVIQNQQSVVNHFSDSGLWAMATE
jgi:hypothetical protein